MQKILVLVEGQTEEQYVKQCLNPFFETLGKKIIPKIVMTKENLQGANYKGGTVPFTNFASQIRNLLHDSSSSCVTMMFDYYGLPADYPGRDKPQGNDCFERVQFVEQEIANSIGHRKFLPFLALHEFEGILFSDADELYSSLPIALRPNPFRVIREQFATPEEINDNPTTRPSARILNYVKGYQKPLHGSIISSRIGIDVCRRECPHFNRWIERLIAV